MKKFLLPLALILTGCFHATWNDSKPAPLPKEDPIPVIIARGTDTINSWDCSLEELNTSLVWVECKFTNHWPAIAGNSTANSCINVGFYDETTGKLVVESRKICSGPLRTGQISTNYAAFIKENRRSLRACGELLNLCVMLAGSSE